jgi:hypothetical protein
MVQCSVMSPSLPSIRLVVVIGALATGCATTGLEPSHRLRIAASMNNAGTRVSAQSRFRYSLDYRVDGFQEGQDRVVARLRTRDGGAWTFSTLTLPSYEGGVTINVIGAELLKRDDLVRPFRLVFALERGDGQGKFQTLAKTEEVRLEVATAQPAVATVAQPTGGQASPSGGKVDASGYRQLPPNVGSGRLVSDILNDPRFRPTLPRELNVRGATYAGLYKICVTAAGEVSDITVIRSANDWLDDRWRTTMRRWQYRPYTVDGQPVPFCYPMRVELRSR